MNSGLTHAAIIPLIGGQTLGVMEALGGKLPEYVLSYSAFKSNDSHFISYLRDKKKWIGDYIVLDELEEGEYTPRPQVDIINAVPPCAGLSSLNVKSSVDWAANDWMYITTEHVLGKEKPRVFFGENAPRLSTNKGKPVVDRLKEIGRKYGYTMGLFYTESKYHGNPQKRPRTFFIFYKESNPRVPLLPWVNKDSLSSCDILRQPISEDDSMNIVITQGKASDNPWIKYIMMKNGVDTIMEYYNKIEKTISCLPECDRLSNRKFSEIAEWFDSQGFDSRYSRRARYIQGKIDAGLNYWQHGMAVPKGEIPSMINGQPTGMVNPFEDRFLTIRECLRIMRMPDDFELVGNNPKSLYNHICQNVIVTTAQDITEGLIRYLRGDLEFMNVEYLKQNNVNQKIEYDEEVIQKLDPFLT